MSWPFLLRRPLLASQRAVLGGGVLALFAPLFAPHDPVEQDLMAQYIPPF